MQSPKNIRNLGTRFLRKVLESEEGLTRKSWMNVKNTDLDTAILKNEVASLINQ